MNQTLMRLPNPISCEIDSSFHRLVCGYISYVNKTYCANIIVMNEYFNWIDEEKMLTNSTKSLLYLKLQKKGDDIIYLVPQESFIIKLQNNGNKLNITSSVR